MIPNRFTYLQKLKKKSVEFAVKLWEANYFTQVHVPLVVLVFYFVSFAVLHSSILSIPVGVNYVFASLTWKYLALLAAANSVVIFMILQLLGGGKLVIKKPDDTISKGDHLLLLLPLTPVVQYIINNQEILSSLGALSVILVFLLFSSVYVFLIPACLGFVGSARTWISLGLAFVFTIISMASLSHNFSWLHKGELGIQLLFLGTTFLITWLLSGLNNRKILRLLIAIVFVTNSTVQILSVTKFKTGSPTSFEGNKLQSLLEGKIPAMTPNIYLLVYDAYVPNETMLGYGIDNRAQEEYLQDSGFTIYPHTYSVDRFSIGTMSRVLNVSTDLYSNERRGVSGDGIVQNTLKNLGYRTFGIFPHNFYFLEIDPTYDFTFPGRPSSPGILSRAILMGEFRFDVGFDTVNRGQYMQEKQRVFEDISGDLNFVYTHSNFPNHSQNSGICLPDEVDLYQERLMEANSEMRQDVDMIIQNDPESIVIISGDHGPYLTKSCWEIEDRYDASEISRLDLQDRFGTFLAIKWPSEDAFQFDDITVLQDIFPALFAYMFNDVGILESKIDSTTISSFLVKVEDGIIHGGINDGEPLFIGKSP